MVEVVLQAAVVDQDVGIFSNNYAISPVSDHEIAQSDSAVGSRVDDDARCVLPFDVAIPAGKHGVDIGLHARSSLHRDVAVGSGDDYDLWKLPEGSWLAGPRQHLCCPERYQGFFRDRPGSMLVQAEGRNNSLRCSYLIADF